MGGKLCGYCRELGHNARVCHHKAAQILGIRRHVAGERRALHDLLVLNGYGVGAILQTTTYGGKQEQYVITTMNDVVTDNFENMVDWRIHKYRKSVRSSLRSWTGVNHLGHEADGYFITFHNADRVYLSCRALNDMSRKAYAMVYLSKLPNPPLWTKDVKPGFYAAEHTEVICPSHDSDVDPSLYLRPYRLHERLGKDDRGYGITVNPVMPT